MLMQHNNYNYSQSSNDLTIGIESSYEYDYVILPSKERWKIWQLIRLIGSSIAKVVSTVGHTLA